MQTSFRNQNRKAAINKSKNGFAVSTEQIHFLKVGFGSVIAISHDAPRSYKCRSTKFVAFKNSISSKSLCARFRKNLIAYSQIHAKKNPQKEGKRRHEKGNQGTSGAHKPFRPHKISSRRLHAERRALLCALSRDFAPSNAPRSDRIYCFTPALRKPLPWNAVPPNPAKSQHK